jgi:hypothetical protein
MVILGRLAVNIREYFEYVLMGYIFLIYTGIIIPIYLISASISVHLGLPEDPTITTGVVLAVVASVIVSNWIAKSVASSYQLRLHNKKSSNLIWISMILVILLFSIIYRQSITVSWMPGLGLGLLLYGLVLKGWKGRRIFIVSGLMIIAFSPIAVYYTDAVLAAGIVGVSYTIAGILSLREALKSFYKG